jgi:catechol 2,3-dioxygenase-like lactoylglutathione lyase family enzyme
MERFIADLIGARNSGMLNRRQFCETLALAATVYTVGESAANAAPAQGFKPIAINHISYACADYRKARDFYSSVFGMENLPRADNGHESRLMLGPPPGKGGAFIIPRNGRTTSNAKAVVDHVCYAIANWDETRIRAALATKGLMPTGSGNSLHLYDPFDYDVQIIAAGPSSSGGATTEPAFKVTRVDHISYTGPDFKRAADWYSKIFNLEQIGVTDSEVTLPFGKKGDGLPSLIVRTRNAQAEAQKGQPARKAKALVNHVAYTIGDFDKERVRAELKRLGYANPLQDGEYSFHIVDPNGFDVQISGIQMTALAG